LHVQSPRGRELDSKLRRYSKLGGRRMACLSAIQHEPRIREFYRSLRARGKPGKVAVVAAMRKMLVILNARARDALAGQAQAIPT
ncbi:hypothetical protein ABQW67_22185, partial [Xanthomonas hortorum]